MMNRILDGTEDDVAVYKGFEQVFRAARPLSASVKVESKLMEHPIESGAVVTDHKVDQPVQIEMALLITGADYRAVYEEIRSLYADGTLLSVQTRSGSYDNQVIEALPHEETPDYFDALSITLKTKEVRIVTAEYEDLPPSKVKNKSQASTRKGGEVQPQEEETSQGSWAYDVFGKK